MMAKFVMKKGCLHNNLIKDVNEGGLLNVWNDNKILVSETALRLLLSP